MNCDICQTKPASVFYSHLAGGKLQKVNLCESCAEEKGVTDPTAYSMDQPLEGVGEETVTEKPVAADELVCGSCGFTQTDFKKTGRFGCAECYRVFGEGLEGLLEAMHKHTRHRGKVPAKVAASPEPSMAEKKETKESAPASVPAGSLEKLDELRKALDASVEAEDYEEAARLRDAISQMESQAGGP